jgi:hypothetical protein
MQVAAEAPDKPVAQTVQALVEVVVQIAVAVVAHRRQLVVRV